MRNSRWWMFNRTTLQQMPAMITSRWTKIHNRKVFIESSFRLVLNKISRQQEIRWFSSLTPRNSSIKIWKYPTKLHVQPANLLIILHEKMSQDSGNLQIPLVHHRRKTTGRNITPRLLHSTHENRNGPTHAPAATARTIASCTKRCKSMFLAASQCYLINSCWSMIDWSMSTGLLCFIPRDLMMKRVIGKVRYSFTDDSLLLINATVPNELAWCKLHLLTLLIKKVDRSWWISCL